MAASAAATVIINNVKICPDISFRNIEKDTKRRKEIGLNAKNAFSTSSVKDIYKIINEKI